MILRVMLAAAMLSLATIGSNAAAQEDGETLAERERFFYSLVPGIRASAIQESIGAADAKREGLPAWRLARGVVTMEAQGDRVMFVSHWETGDAMRVTLYRTGGEAPSEADLRKRHKRVEEGDLAETRGWGYGVYTARHEGRAYLLPEGYLVVTPVCGLMGATGAFQHRAARVVIHDAAGDGTVAWRLFDEWEQERPKQLSPEAVAKRDRLLRQLGSSLVGTRIERLGEPDGLQGSGIAYYQYYTSGGLLTVTVGQRGLGAAHDGRIASASLWQPGADEQRSLAEWLAQSGEEK